MAPFSHHSHVALLICAYKPGVSETEKHRFAGKLVGLQELCRRGAGEGGGKYVVSVEAGAEESDGTFSKGFEQVFVFRLSSAEDREYFLHSDPAHLEVAKEFEAANVVSDRMLLCFENSRF